MANPTPTGIERAGLADDQMRFWLAIIVIGNLTGFIGLACFIPPKLPGDTVGVILGYFAGWVSAIVGFYFGSSSSSKMKTMQANPDNKIVTSVPTSEATTTTVKTENKE